MGANLALARGYARSFQGTRAYSQQLENCWSKLKAYLRKVAARSRELLEEAISLGLDLITELDIRNWFAHGCYCTS